MRGVTLQILCFGVISGILYLHGYWSTFGITIFEYANFKDIIIASIIIVGLGLVFAFLGIILGILITPYQKIEETHQKIENYKESGDHEDLEEAKQRLAEVKKTLLVRFCTRIYETKLCKFLLKRGLLIIIYLIGLVVIGVISFPSKTVIFGGLSGLGGIFIVSDSEFLSEIKHSAIRGILIYILFFAISTSYFFGKDRANAILDDGPKTLYEVESERKYLGHTNGYFFLLSPDNSKVTVIRAKSLGDLVLTRNVSKPPKKNNDETQNLPTESETGHLNEEAQNAERGGNSHPNVKRK